MNKVLPFFLYAILLASLLLGLVQTTALSKPGGADFLPDPDGFGFRNYSTQYPEGDLTIADVYELFGEQVCTSVTNGTCTPTPDAQFWIDTMNGYMESGHCEGFTVMAYRFFTAEFKQTTFTTGADTTFEVAQEKQIMRKIAVNFTYQVFEEVWRAVVEGTPSQIVTALKKLNQPVNLGIYSLSGYGHSVLAYAVEDRGNNITWIRIYDNNDPGKQAYIEVDTKANTWKYMPPELAPDGDGDDWQGDKNSNSLTFTPFSAYELPPECPFCEGGGRADSGGGSSLAIASGNAATAAYQHVTASGAGVDLEITNKLGQRFGRRLGLLLNEIAGARLIRMRSGLSTQDLYYLIPGGQDYTFTAQTNGSGPIGNVDIRSFGGGMYFSVDGLTLTPGLQEQVVLGNGGQTVSFISGSDQSPSMKLAFSVGGVTYMVVVGNIDMSTGSQLTIGFDPATQQLSLSVNGVTDPEISLAFARIEGTDIQIFATGTLQLGPNGTAVTNLLGWDGESSFTLSLDVNGDGVFEGTSVLPDLPLSELIEQGDTSIEIISQLAEFAPYMNEGENDAFTEMLLTLGLDGSELGKVFFAFDLFGMSLQELAQYLMNLGNLYDIARFIAELHLSPEELAQLIGLFPFDWQLYLSAQLAMLEKLVAAYYEGTFDGMTGDELLAYVEEYLTSEIVPLLPGTLPTGLPTLPFSPVWSPLIGEPSLPPPQLPLIFD